MMLHLYRTERTESRYCAVSGPNDKRYLLLLETMLALFCISHIVGCTFGGQSRG